MLIAATILTYKRTNDIHELVLPCRFHLNAENKGQNSAEWGCRLHPLLRSSKRKSAWPISVRLGVPAADSNPRIHGSDVVIPYLTCIQIRCGRTRSTVNRLSSGLIGVPPLITCLDPFLAGMCLILPTAFDNGSLCWSHEARLLHDVEADQHSDILGHGIESLYGNRDMVQKWPR